MQDSDERQRLIAFMRDGGVIRDLESEIREIRREEETGGRSRAVASGRTGSMSRDMQLIGTSPAGAKREADAAMKGIEHNAI